MNFLRRSWATLRQAYWFIPAMMCAGSVVAAVALTQWDLRRGLDLGGISWLVASQASGARALLSMVAGSMITVAGVAFSVTLVALATAAGTYGPRVLNLFSTDRAVQVSLGAFCATFLYCTLVLRMVGDGSDEELFVPQLAVLGAIALAILSLSMFIYFIHHMAQSVHVASIVERSTKELGAALRRQPRGADLIEPPEAESSSAPADSHVVRSDTWGYTLPPDHDELIRLAKLLQTTIHVLPVTGEFVSVGAPLARVVGPVPIDEDARDVVRAAIPQSRRRSAIGDPDFFIDQLVQIAARALSPGVNDPFTATTCIDALEGVFSAAQSPDPRWAVWADEDGASRVYWRRPSYDDHLKSFYGQLWPYAADDPLARRHLVASLQTLFEGGASPAMKRAAARQIATMRESGVHELRP